MTTAITFDIFIRVFFSKNDLILFNDNEKNNHETKNDENENENIKNEKINDDEIKNNEIKYNKTKTQQKIIDVFFLKFRSFYRR